MKTLFAVILLFVTLSVFVSDSSAQVVFTTTKTAPIPAGRLYSYMEHTFGGADSSVRINLRKQFNKVYIYLYSTAGNTNDTVQVRGGTYTTATGTTIANLSALVCRTTWSSTTQYVGGATSANIVWTLGNYLILEVENASGLDFVHVSRMSARKSTASTFKLGITAVNTDIPR